MKFYLRTAILYIIALLTIHFSINFSLQTLIDFLIVIAIMCLPAVPLMILCRSLPKKVYNEKNFIYRVRPHEKKVYEKLNVKKWKNAIPEGGGIGGFRKDKLQKPTDPTYIKKFIEESCIAEAIHTSSICWGIISLVIIPWKLILPWGLPILVFNTFIHICPVLIQRYLRPRLIKTYEFLIRKQNKETPATTEISEAK